MSAVDRPLTIIEIADYLDKIQAALGARVDQFGRGALDNRDIGNPALAAVMLERLSYHIRKHDSQQRQDVQAATIETVLDRIANGYADNEPIHAWAAATRAALHGRHAG